MNLEYFSERTGALVFFTGELDRGVVGADVDDIVIGILVIIRVGYRC
jgi:hypothetical protein